MDYERGLAAFKQLAESTNWYQDFTVHEAALRENLRDERRYGPAEQSRRDRARLVDQLNALALEHLGISFNDLCLGVLPSPRAQPQTPAAERGQRCADLAEHIRETLELIKQYEDQRRLADDPKAKRRVEREIAELRVQLDAYQAEYRELGCR